MITRSFHPSGRAWPTTTTRPLLLALSALLTLALLLGWPAGRAAAMEPAPEAAPVRAEDVPPEGQGLRVPGDGLLAAVAPSSNGLPAMATGGSLTTRDNLVFGPGGAYNPRIVGTLAQRGTNDPPIDYAFGLGGLGGADPANWREFGAGFATGAIDEALTPFESPYGPYGPLGGLLGAGRRWAQDRLLDQLGIDRCNESYGWGRDVGQAAAAMADAGGDSLASGLSRLRPRRGTVSVVPADAVLGPLRNVTPGPALLPPGAPRSWEDYLPAAMERVQDAKRIDPYGINPQMKYTPPSTQEHLGNLADWERRMRDVDERMDQAESMAELRQLQKEKDILAQEDAYYGCPYNRTFCQYSATEYAHPDWMGQPAPNVETDPQGFRRWIGGEPPLDATP